MKAVRSQRYLARRGDILYFRRGVPEDARSAFGGRTNVWVSLQTSNVAEARHRLQRELDKFEALVSQCRSEIAPAKIASAPYRPTLRELEAGVRDALAERLERVTPVRRGDRESVSAAVRRLDDLKRMREDLIASRQLSSDGPGLETEWAAEALCERNGWLLEAGSDFWFRLLDLMARAQLEAAERQLQALQGLPSQIVDDGFAPEQFIRDQRMRLAGELRTGVPVLIEGLFDAYVKERNPAPATVKSFGSKVRAFIAFLGHDDARRVTKQDVIRWKQHLLERGGRDGGALNARTVREGFLPALRVTLERGVERGDLSENVAAGIGVLGRKKMARKRQASFFDHEAEIILRASLEPQSSKLAPESALARRWVPWLCAYTGARVNEMTQLRAEDVSEVAGIWMLRITPEAGGTKDGNARLVPLHPHLIEQGFVEIATARRGHLFVDPARRRGGSPQNPHTKKVGERLAEWVRAIGVDDPAVQPNHGWRHRFKTMARECRMSEEVRDYIVAHAPRTVGEGYGEFTPKVLLREIERLPRYEVG